MDTKRQQQQKIQQGKCDVEQQIKNTQNTICTSQKSNQQRKKETYFNNAQNGAACLHRKKVLVHKQNKGYNINTKVI